VKNTFGNNVSVTLFGESHGEYIGAVLDGIKPGLLIDEEFIRHQLTLRRPNGKISTSRVEEDKYNIVSGVFEGKTTGAPITLLIPNENIRSNDYKRNVLRPSHADYTAYVKYGGNEDYRGGGHFSGRLTAALVAVGAIAISALRSKNIIIASHIKRLAGIDDREINNFEEDFKYLNDTFFAVLDKDAEEKMTEAIIKAKEEGDSVGGVIETVILGLPAGIGEPWFDTVEGVISHALFSIPAVKGVEFGAGFGLCDMKGSAANDELYIENGKIFTKTNNSGGINGGISNGMPIVVRSAVKPTPTIFKTMDSVNIVTGQNEKTAFVGRHDPCIVHRARVVCDSVCAIALCDLLGDKL